MYGRNRRIITLDRLEAPMSSIEDQVLEKLRDLPPDKQKEVLEFVDLLKQKNDPHKPRRAS